ncbi:MAG: hypothetical protein DRI36_05270, partial [Caldiserica bacterium]
SYTKTKLYKTYGYLSSIIYYEGETGNYIISVGEDSNIYYLFEKNGNYIPVNLYPGRGSLYSIEYKNDEFIISGSDGYLGIYEIENGYLKETAFINFQGNIYWSSFDENTSLYIAGGDYGKIYTAKKSTISIPEISHIPEEGRIPLFPFPEEDITIEVKGDTETVNLTLYFKTESATSFSKINFTQNKATISNNFSSGTVVEYYIEAVKNSDIFYLYSYGSSLSDVSSYGITTYKEIAISKPFKFIIGGKGECFHKILEGMRSPLYPLPNQKLTLYVGNLAFSPGNYGNMIGGSLFYKTDSDWNEVYLSWDRDEYPYKYWKAELTLQDYSNFEYYFKVNYDDHLTTYVFGDKYSSFTSTDEAKAKENPFEIDEDFAVLKGTVNPPLSIIKIFENGTLNLKNEIETDSSGYYELRIETGTFDVYVLSSGYKTEKKTVKISTGTTTLNFNLLEIHLPREISITGNLYIDFSPSELVSSDPMNDSQWGSNNEVGDFYVSYSTDTLYLGIEGKLENNSIVAYIDVGDWYGNIRDANNLPWGVARNHYFPTGFYPDYEIQIWNFSSLNFYRITSSTTIEDVTGDIEYKFSNNSMVVVSIPFNTLYSGYVEKYLPAGTTFQFIISMTGGEGSSAHDTNPDQQSSFGYNWNDPFTFDTFIKFPIDLDRDNLPDSETVRGWPSEDYSPFPTPEISEIELISSDTVKIRWRDVGGNYGIYVSTSENETGYLHSENITQNYIEIGNLRNLTYYFRVFSIDENGNRSYLSEEKSFLLSSFPSITHEVVSEFNYPGKEIYIKANFSNDTVDKKLYYRIEGEDETYEVPFEIDTATIPANHTEREKIYYWIVAKNTSGNTKNFGSEEEPYIIKINNTKESDVLPDEEKKIYLNSTDETKSYIKIDKFTFSRKVNLKFSYLNPYSVDLSLPDPELSFPVEIYSIKIQPYTPPEKDMEITLKYFDENLSGVDESKLLVFWFDSNNWNPISSNVDTENNTISFKTKRTGTFAIFESPSNIDLSSSGLIEVKNSIFIPSSENYELKSLKFITNEVDSIEIKIFTPSGKLIRKIKNSTEWNGKTEEGNKAEPGVYIYEINVDGKIYKGLTAIVR